MSKTKIYGHRGSMGVFPENTLLGFREAIHQGVDGLELDVHMTKDGEIVVIHDESLDRTTNGMGRIQELTLAEIKQYSAGTAFSEFERYDETWDQEQVPTLIEVLELLENHSIELNIELKTTENRYEGIEEKVMSIVEEYGSGQKVIYSSFHLPTLLRLKAINSDVNIALLLMNQLPQVGDYLQELDLEALHVYKNTVLAMAHHWRGYAKKLRVWTVNDADRIKQLLDMNVEALITDYPEKAIFYRSERNTFV